MISWINNVHALLTLEDTPDERIIALVPAGIMDAALILGSTLATDLETAEDPTWSAAVSHFLAARLIISSRTLLFGQGFPDSNALGTQWGEGSERPSELTELRAMANNFKQHALKLCSSILAAQTTSDDTPAGWYDI